MKTIQLSVEDTHYDDLMALIAKLPSEKIHIQQVTQADIKPEVSVEEASDYVLKKNAELYERAGESVNKEALAIHEQLMDEYSSSFERLAK